jgi:hypothetical protein
MKHLPTILEDHARIGIDAGWILRRIMSHLPASTLDGLNQVRLLGRNEKGFARYIAKEGIIEIYIEELVKGFSPLFLRLFYPFTYTIIGMALCHELDHHVHRNDGAIDREASAEANIMKYMYPSLGIFKPLAQLILFCRSIRKRTNNERPDNHGIHRIAKKQGSR